MLAVADVYLAVVVDKLVHATRAERGADNVGNGGTCIDVRNELRFALRGVCTLLQQNNRWLHSHAAAPSHHLGDTLIKVRALRVCVRAAMHTDAIAVPRVCVMIFPSLSETQDAMNAGINAQIHFLVNSQKLWYKLSRT